MHDDHRHVVQSRHLGHFRRALQAMHIVDDARTRLDGLVGHQRLVGVDGNRRGNALGNQRVDDWHDPVQFLLHTDRCSAGPRAFATDIDDIGALGQHQAGMGDGAGEPVMLATIGKAVRRDIENAHDDGLCAKQERRAVGQGNGMTCVHC
ncbi:hypothetical protein FQZ97_1131680 [compost metagenome]